MQKLAILLKVPLNALNIIASSSINCFSVPTATGSLNLEILFLTRCIWKSVLIHCTSRLLSSAVPLIASNFDIDVKGSISPIVSESGVNSICLSSSQCTSFPIVFSASSVTFPLHSSTSSSITRCVASSASSTFLASLFAAFSISRAKSAHAFSMWDRVPSHVERPLVPLVRVPSHRYVRRRPASLW